MKVDLEKLKLEHLKAYTLIRRVGEIGLKRDCRRGFNSKTLAEWQRIIDIGINGERQTLGMRHLDLNVAIEELTKAGYIVSENGIDIS